MNYDFLFFFCVCINWFVKKYCMLWLIFYVIRGFLFWKLYYILSTYWLTRVIQEITIPFSLRLRESFYSYGWMVSNRARAKFSTWITSSMNTTYWVRGLGFRVTICKSSHPLPIMLITFSKCRNKRLLHQFMSDRVLRIRKRNIEKKKNLLSSFHHATQNY